MRRTRSIGIIAGVAALALAATPVVAQDDADESMGEAMGDTVEVIGVDYAFEGVPESIAAGTTLSFTNQGVEFHEMAVIRVTDEVTPLEELRAMPEEETAAISEFVGFTAAFPGTTAEGTVTITDPGRYVLICNINQGSDPTRFIELGFDPSELGPETDPSTLPPEVAELLAEIESNPSHLELGMVTEFTAVAA